MSVHSRDIKMINGLTGRQTDTHTHARTTSLLNISGRERAEQAGNRGRAQREEVRRRLKGIG